MSWDADLRIIREPFDHALVLRCLVDDDDEVYGNMGRALPACTSKTMSATSSEDMPVLKLATPQPPWLLTESAARTWAEAAAVCFEEVGHRDQIEMTVQGFAEATQVLVRAPAVDDAMRRTNRNLKDATEYGAISVVTCLVHGLTEHVVLEAVPDHTGCDYLLADRKGPLFQGSVRLEISGILRETPSNTIRSRIKQKAARLDEYPDERPAKIAVVEFSNPLAVMGDHG